MGTYLKEKLAAVLHALLGDVEHVKEDWASYKDAWARLIWDVKNFKADTFRTAGTFSTDNKQRHAREDLQHAYTAVWVWTFRAPAYLLGHVFAVAVPAFLIVWFIQA